MGLLGDVGLVEARFALLLINPLLALTIGRGDTGSAQHERPLVGPTMRTACFPSNFSLPRFLTLSARR
jgi:hypothetical protein